MHHAAMRCVIGLIFLCLAPATGLAQAVTGKPLILAVHPYLPAPEIQSRFAPLAEYLAAELGRPVSVRVGTDYEQHVEAIGRDSVDIAFLGPAPYVKVVERYGRKPMLARFEVDGKPYLFGAIVVRRDSPLRNIAGLKGKRFAFGDPDSTMSHIVPRYMLEQAGVPLTALAGHEFLGAHKNVALAVLAGDYDAGAVKAEILDEFAARGLRALATTPPVADHVFVTRADFPPQDVEKLRRALLELGKRPGGKAVLERLHKGMTALIPAADSDYENLRPMVRAIEAASR